MKIKNLFVFLKSKLGTLYSKNKKLFVFVLIFVLVVVFYFVSFQKDSSSEESGDENLVLSKTGGDEYKDELENKISKMLLSIDEVKSAEVMVVCDESEKYVYLKNMIESSTGSGDSASKTITEEVVYEKNGSNSSPIIVSRVMPKVLGVWIVISEVSPSTKLAIINSISSVLNIDESCISILQER